MHAAWQVTDYLHPSAFVIDYLDKTYPWAKFPYIQRVCVHLRLGQSTDQMISYQPPRLSALYALSWIKIFYDTAQLDICVAPLPHTSSW